MPLRHSLGRLATLGLLVVALITLHAVFSHPLRATTFTSCPGADPYDSYGDSAALQYCLDNYDVTVLTPGGGGGYVGYIIDNYAGKGVRVRNNGRGYGPIIITDGDGDYGKAVLIADPSLSWAMMDVESGTEAWEFHQLIIDGNRYNRDPDDCTDDYRPAQSNVLAKGSDFSIVGVESDRALCGSSIEVAGDNFFIWSSTFYDNGTEVQNASSGTHPWSDGLTLLRCDYGYVRIPAIVIAQSGHRDRPFRAS